MKEKFTYEINIAGKKFNLSFEDEGIYEAFCNDTNNLLPKILNLQISDILKAFVIKSQEHHLLKKEIEALYQKFDKIEI